MSLTPDFFARRAAKEEALREKGYTPLDTLLQHGITAAQLRRAGLLADKAIAGSADLDDFELTTLGTRYFTAMKRHQLIILKPDRLTALRHHLAQTAQE